MRRATMSEEATPGAVVINRFALVSGYITSGTDGHSVECTFN